MSGRFFSDAELMAPLPAPAPAAVPVSAPVGPQITPPGPTAAAPGPTAAGPTFLSDADIMAMPAKVLPDDGRQTADLPGLFARGLFRGAGESASNSAATLSGNAFKEPEATPAAPGADPLSQSLAQGYFRDGGWHDPAWYAANLGHGLGAGAPGLVLGLGGAAAGGATMGPWGAIGGGAAGMAAGSAMPALREAYVAARRDGLDPDQASDQAMKVAGVSGVTGAVMGAMGGLGKIFEGSITRVAAGNLPSVITPGVVPEVGQMVLKAPLVQAGPTGRALASPLGQALITQPTIGAVGQQAQGLITGHEPTADDYAAGYVSNALMGGPLALVHGGPPSRIRLRPEVGPEPIPGQPRIGGGPERPAAQGGPQPNSGPPPVPAAATPAPGGPQAPVDGAGQGGQIVGPTTPTNRTGNDGSAPTAPTPGSATALGGGGNPSVPAGRTDGGSAGSGGPGVGRPAASGGAENQQPGIVPPAAAAPAAQPGAPVGAAPAPAAPAPAGQPPAPAPQGGAVAQAAPPSGQDVDGGQAPGPGPVSGAGPVAPAGTAEPVAPAAGSPGLGGGDGASDNGRGKPGGGLQPGAGDVAGAAQASVGAGDGGQPVPAGAGPDRAPGTDGTSPPAGRAAGEAGRGETVSTATGRKVDTRFEVVDAASLKPAGGDLQPRDRAGRAASDAQITSIAASLDPERLHSSPEADRGAPIVGPDGVVESGNGRVAAIRQAYQGGRGADYRAMIEARGHSTAGMAEPVLIRRRTTDMAPDERRSFVQEANQAATQRMSAPEQAASDARSLSSGLLAKYDPSVTGGALAAGNRDFVRSWVNTLPEGERNAVMDPGGALSAEGHRRLQGAMLARAYDDKGTLSRMLESTDDNTKTLTGALTDAAPAWAKLRAGIQDGQVPPELDITRDLIRAVELVGEARNKGQSARDIIAQQDAFNPLSPAAEGLIRAFHNDTLTRPAGRPRVAEVLRRYAEEAEKQTTGATLFGPADKLKPEDILATARKSASPETAPAQQLSLTPAAPKADPVAPEPASPPAPANDPEPPAAPGQVLETIDRSNTKTPAQFEDKLEAAYKAGHEVWLIRPNQPDQRISQSMENGVLVNRGALNYGIAAGILNRAGSRIEVREGQGAAPGAPAKGKALAHEFSGTMDLLHAQSASFGTEPDLTSFDPKAPGERYEGNIFGDDAVYLDNTTDKRWAFGHPSVLFSATRAYAVKADFKRAAVFTPETAARLIAETGHQPVVPPEGATGAAADANALSGTSFADALRAKGYDALIISGFDELPGTGKGSERPNASTVKVGKALGIEPALVQNQVVAFDPKSLTVGKRVLPPKDHPGHDFMRGHLEATPKAPAAPAKAPRKRASKKVAESDLERMADAPPAEYRPDTTMGMPLDPNYQRGPSDRVRQAFTELGVADPDGMVSKPLAVQAHLLRQAVVSKYGLAGIDIEAQADPRQTVDQLADAHRNMAWMTHIMGAPLQTIGLGGTVRLWLGRENSPHVETSPGQFAFGVYSPATRTIYMPGRTNSFAHEWTHALDHYLADALGSNSGRLPLLSTTPDEWMNAPPTTAAGAFAQLMANIYGHDANRALTYMQAQAAARARPTPANARALAAARQAFHATDFHRNAVRVSPNYMAQPYEMLARSHEAFISNRVAAAGGQSGFVSKEEAAYLNEADQRMRVSYPKADERNRIFRAWDAVHAALVQEQVYPNGVPTPLPAADIGGIGPNHWREIGAAPASQNARAANSVRQTVAQGSWATRFMENAGFDRTKGSDPGYLTANQRRLDMLRAFTYTPRGIMNAIHARIPLAARAPMRELIDHLTTDPGSGRLVRQTYEEQVSTRTRRDINGYSAATRRAGLLEQSHGQAARDNAEMMHQALTQREDIMALPARIQSAIRNFRLHLLPARDQAIFRDAMMNQGSNLPENIRRWASDVRFMLDQRAYELRQAGFDIEYQEGYFPRVYDDHRVYADRQGFIRDATQAMAIRFEREVETDPQELRDRYRAVRDRLTPAEQAAIDAEMRQRSGPNSPAPTRADELIRDPNLMAAIQNAWATEAATEWQRAIVEGHSTAFTTRGPASNHLRSRAMPPETDAIMRDWLLTDPHEVLPSYFHKTNRSIAYVERFGHGPVNHIDNLISRAIQGGMRPEDATQMRQMTELITGRLSRGADSHALRRGLEWVHGLGTMALMPRAVFSSLSEPMAILARTGSVRATYEGFAQSIRDLVGGDEPDRIAQIAQYMGLVTSSHFESILSDRTGATYSDSASLGRVMTRYFRRTGLTGLTNAQRRGGLVGGHVYLHSLAVDLLGNNARRERNAQAALFNLGIPGPEQVQFATALREYQRVPDIGSLQGTRFGELYQTAQTRFVNEINQDPQASQKPAFSQTNSFGRMAYGLMGFNYSFFSNVVERFVADTERQWHEANGFAEHAAVGARGAGAAIASVAAMWAGQLIATAVREALFNGTAWDEHKKKGDLGVWLSDLAFARIGLNGPLDPIIQAYTALRYQRELSSLTAGAQLGHFLSAGENILKGFTSTDKTNTGRYNAIKGFYEFAAVPAAAWALTAVPGGRAVGGVAGALMQQVTSNGAGDWVARQLVGEKGNKRDDELKDTDPRVAMREQIAKAKKGEDDTDKKADHGGGSALVGLLDDFIPAGVRLMNSLPGPARAVSGAVALGAAGIGLARDFAHYRR